MTSRFASFLSKMLLSLVLLFAVTIQASALPPECLLLLRKTLPEIEITDFSLAKVQEGSYATKEELFSAAKKSMTPEEFKKFEEWYYSHFFFDRNEILVDSLQIKDPGIYPPVRYNKGGEYPFDGYLKARHTLSETDLNNIDADTLKKIHRELMSKDSVAKDHGNFLGLRRNSEKTPTSALGVMREERVGYYLSGSDTGVSSITRLTNNGKLQRSATTFEELEKTSPFLKITSKNFAEYTPLSEWRRYADKLSKQTVARLETLSQNVAQLNSNSAEINALRKQVLTELVDSALSTLKAELKQAKTKDEVINAAAKFHHDFILIHPFRNGNGRMSRMLTERVLTEFNIPPPIWTHWGEDAVLSVEDFADLMRDSASLSDKFHRQVKTLMDAGISYQYVPSPYLTREIVTKAEDAGVSLVPEEFLTWVANSKLKVSNMNEAIQEYDKWRKTYQYSSSEGGIRFVPPLFQRMFGKISETADEFRFKMDNYYADDILYRGVSSQSVPTDEEILQHFTQTQPIMAGMGVSPTAKPDEISPIFDAFNRQLAQDPKKLNTIISDHVDASGKYWDSKFNSFSRAQSVAEDFKNGFLMPGWHKEKMRARIEVNVRERKVGAVDVMQKTKQVPNYGIPEEREVLILASAEPESVTRVIVDDIEPQNLTKNDKAKWGTIAGRFKTLKTRVAERISWDEVRMTVTEDGKEPYSNVYKILPDGKFKLLLTEMDKIH